MLFSYSKKLKIILFLPFILFFIANLFYFSPPAKAAPNTSMPNLDINKLQVQIPTLTKFTQPTECGTDAQGNKKFCVSWIGEYIAAIYKYAIGIVGILAAVVLMIGGVMWIIAGGSATMIGEAKAWIGASLTGLVIALCSYLILFQINPALTIFGPLGITQVKKVEAPTGEVCQWVSVLSGKYCSDTSVLGTGWVNSDSSKCTGAAADLTYECCCQTLGGIAMCKPTAPAPTSCQACNNCETTTIPCKESPCLINKTLDEKLKSLYSSFSNWRINEPWPPTVPHDSPCHKDGTCVDIGLTNQPISCSDVNNIIQKATQLGFSQILNEYAGCGGTTYETTTGGNIHIKL